MSKSDPESEHPTRSSLLLRLAGAALLGRWRRYEIADRSMEPTLRDGDWTVGIHRPRTLSPGDVVVTALPEHPDTLVVKRIAAVDPIDGSIWLRGDNPGAGSVDSRTFGSVAAEAIQTRLMLRYRPLPPRFIR